MKLRDFVYDQVDFRYILRSIYLKSDINVLRNMMKEVLKKHCNTPFQYETRTSSFALDKLHLSKLALAKLAWDKSAFDKLANFKLAFRRSKRERSQPERLTPEMKTFLIKMTISCKICLEIWVVDHWYKAIARGMRRHRYVSTVRSRFRDSDVSFDLGLCRSSRAGGRI